MTEQELLTPEEVREWLHADVGLFSHEATRLCRDYLTLHDLLENAKDGWAEHEKTCSDLYYRAECAA